MAGIQTNLDPERPPGSSSESPGIEWWAALAVIVLLLLSGLGFLVMWGERATNIVVDSGTNAVVGQTGVTYFVNSTVSFENYAPDPQTLTLGFVRNTLDPHTKDIVSTDPLNTSSALADFNLSVRQVSVQRFYGSQPLGPASVSSGVSLTLEANYTAQTFTKLVLNVTWTWHVGSPVPFTLALVASSMRPWPLDWVPALPAPGGVHAIAAFIRSSILMPLPLVLLGFMWIYLRRGAFASLSKAFGDLVSLNWRGRYDLRATLSELANRPRVISYLEGVFFGAALAIFKLFYRRIAQAKMSERKLRTYGQDDADTKMIAAFLKDDATSPAASLFEPRTLALIAGFLASIGLSFSWNAGAIGPLLLVIGLAYLFWNFGALLYLVHKDHASIALVLALIAIVLLAVAFPDIIVVVRAIP